MHTNTLTIPVSDEALQELQRQAEAEGVDITAVAALALMVGVHGLTETESMFGRFFERARDESGKAENSIAITDQVINAPVPPGYRELDDVIRDREANPQRAAALTRARARLADQVTAVSQADTIASLPK